MTLVIIAAYFGVGVFLARVLPRRYKAYKFAHPESRYDDLNEDWANTEAKVVAVGCLFVWPLLLTGWGIWRLITLLTADSNPWAKERELKGREQRIRDLERELGIGQPGSGR